MTQITPIDSSLSFKERVELFYLRANCPLLEMKLKGLWMIIPGFQQTFLRL
jgi:hypothetical protein